MKRSIYKVSRGYTLIELIVVIAIFSIITSIALFNQGKLNGSILVTNLAYEIALSVREAQTYGVGVRSDGTSGNFEGGYGISFDMTRPDVIYLFTDLDGDGIRNTNESEDASTLTMENQRGNKITALCLVTPSSACVDEGDHSVQSLNIVFKRPNPEAIFKKNDSTSEEEGPAYIVVNTPAGENCRVVVVERTGQIRVDNASSGFCNNSL